MPSYPNELDVYQIADYVNEDMVETFRGGARQVSYQKTINSWEWRIATRVGYAKIVDNNGNVVDILRDYHFWLQTSTGTWCHKPGQTPSVHLGNIRPDTASWDLGNLKNFYNSPTIYMALYRMD